MIRLTHYLNGYAIYICPIDIAVIERVPAQMSTIEHTRIFLTHQMTVLVSETPDEIAAMMEGS